MSAPFVHQSLTLPQKIDSREGLFRCKKGLASECGKMNINSKRPPLAPLLGLFGQNIVQYAAKWRAICRKTQCVLVLNAVYFGAKRKVKWC